MVLPRISEKANPFSSFFIQLKWVPPDFHKLHAHGTRRPEITCTGTQTFKKYVQGSGLPENYMYREPDFNRWHAMGNQGWKKLTCKDSNIMYREPYFQKCCAGNQASWNYMYRDTDMDREWYIWNIHVQGTRQLEITRTRNKIRQLCTGNQTFGNYMYKEPSCRKLHAQGTRLSEIKCIGNQTFSH